MTDKLILALDVDRADEALALVRLLKPYLSLFKVGNQLFTREGSDGTQLVAMHELGVLGALFPELQGHGLTPRAEGKPSIEIPTSDLPGLITTDEAPIHFLIQLDRHAQGPAELVPMTTEAVLKRFEEALYPGPEIRREQIAALRSLSSLKAYKLRYSFLAEAVGKLELLARDTGKTPA